MRSRLLREARKWEGGQTVVDLTNVLAIVFPTSSSSSSSATFPLVWEKHTHRHIRFTSVMNDYVPNVVMDGALNKKNKLGLAHGR